MEHPHKLCCLRQELVDAFTESRYMSFIKLAAYHLQTMGLNKKLIREPSPSNNVLEDAPSSAAGDREVAADPETLKNEDNAKKEEDAKKVFENGSDADKAEGN